MNIYSLLDVVVQLKHRVLLRAPAQPVADQMRSKVVARFANVRGQVNAHNRVSSRTLVVPAGYGPKAEALGAVYDTATNAYVVPDALDEKDAKFAPFWPSAPRDLQNQEGRAELSRDGQVIESLVHPHGDALPRMYGSQVIAEAHARSPHLGLYGAPWQTWLCEHATTGNLEGVNACLGMKAEPNVPSADGDMPLHLAARHGHHHIVRRLVEAGADPALGNPRGETPLHVAAQHKHARCCLELMAAGADPGQFDREGRKPGDVHRGREKGREQAFGL